MNQLQYSTPKRLTIVGFGFGLVIGFGVLGYGDDKSPLDGHLVEQCRTTTTLKTPIFWFLTCYLGSIGYLVGSPGARGDSHGACNLDHRQQARGGPRARAQGGLDHRESYLIHASVPGKYLHVQIFVFFFFLSLLLLYSYRHDLRTWMLGNPGSFFFFFRRNLKRCSNFVTPF